MGHAARAFGGGEGRGSEAGPPSWDPSLEIGVPEDQRPANELAALKESMLYSWAPLSLPAFASRIGGLWLLFFVFLGGPIAAASFDPSKDTLKFVLAGGAGSLFAVAVIVLRMYLGWSYVGDRLLSAVVPYEETGWYDGQLWVKPPEVLARDRLLGSYQVKPIMTRLKQTLVGSASLLVAATLALVLLMPPQQDDGVVYVPRRVRQASSASTSSAMAAATAAPDVVAFRIKDLVNPPLEVAEDDDLAEAAALAAKGRPAYCTDRYYRALAGGQYCNWSDLRD